MNWNNFNIIENENKSFEMMINHLAINYFTKAYTSNLENVIVVNGSGGDGGLECYALLCDGTKIGVQSKWFRNAIKSSQLNQIKKSIDTAIKIHPELIEYIVCIPRDLGNSRTGTDDSEYSNINNLFKLYPNIKFKLWDETEINRLLTEPDNTGIFNFWFNKEYLPINNFKDSFILQKESWLKKRYIPQLYRKGHVSNIINQFLGIEKNYIISILDDKTKKIVELIKDVSQLKDYTDSNKMVVKDIDFKDLIKNLDNLKDNLTKFKYNIELEDNRNILNFDCDYFYKIKDKFRCFRYLDKVYYHLKPVEDGISKLIDFLYEDLDFLLEYYSYIHARTLIITGDSGTGKSNAIAAGIENILLNNDALPILIEAKRIKDYKTWPELISKSLNLGENLSLDVLCHIFSNLSIVLKKLNKHKFKDIQHKVVIFVDGCDEIEPYSLWQNKISEANQISKKYPNIKFIFAGRPYAFKKFFSEDTKKYQISSDGDVSVDELFDVYFNEYNIQIKDNSWLKTYIRTPFALKLFCDVNQNKKIETYNDEKQLYINLFVKKMDSLECDFNELYPNCKVLEGTIKKYIKLLYQNIKTEKISDDNLLEILIKNNVNTNCHAEIIDYLNKEGFLDVNRKMTDQLYGICDIFYDVGIQPYYDFVMSNEWFDESGNYCYNGSQSLNRGVLQLVALNVMENSNNLLSDLLKTDDYALEADCFALTHCSYLSGEKFYKRILNNMEVSPRIFRKIMNKIITPLLKDNNNPLGIKILDDFLNSFESPVKRDIFWSTPGYLSSEGQNDYYWQGAEAIDIFDIEDINKDEYTLSEIIAFTWGLSNLNNHIRKRLRNNIVSWSLKNKEEFCILFRKFQTVNDNQIREDLYSIAMSFVFELNDEAGAEIIEIILDYFGEEFNEEYNCSIRYYVDSILEWGIENKYVEIEKYISFVKEYDSKDIKINESVIKNCNSPQDGYRGITYDLSRYVLIDPMTRHFCNMYYDSPQYPKIEKFLEQFSNDSTGKIRLDYFILAYAYQFLIENGWSCDEIYGNYTSNPIIYGIDSAIHRFCFPATHGSKSETMGITEKYVWLARNKINTIFSANFKFYNNESEYVKVSSYLELDNFVCPAQELLSRKVGKSSNYCQIISNFFNNKDGEDINDYINKIEVLDFKTWICQKIENLSTYLSYIYVNNVDDEVGIETIVWASMCMIEQSKISCLEKMIKTEPNKLYRCFNEPTNIHAVPNVECYVSPKEMCWNNTLEELYDFIKVDDIKFYNTITNVSYNDVITGDAHYYIPSKKVRLNLNIRNTDGKYFYNKSNEINAIVNEVGKGWDTKENSLYIHKANIDNYIEENNMTLCWFFRQKVCTTGKYDEHHKQYRIENDKLFIVIKKEDQYIMEEIKYK